MLRILRVLLTISAFLCMMQGGELYAQAPSAEFAPDDSIVCVGNTVTFNDSSVQGAVSITNWDWNFGDSGTSTSQSPTHNYATGGSFTVRLIVTDANGLKDTAYHSVYVMTAQVASSSVHICSPQNSTTVIATDPNTPGVFGTWFTSSSAVISTPSNDTTLVTNLVSGTYLLFWVVSDGFCSAASQVSVIVDQPVTANAGPDQQICSTSGTATMAATSPSPGTGLWTTTSAAGITTPSSRNTGITGLTIPGTYMFVWTVSNSSCQSRDTMYITVSSPIAAAAGSDKLICNSNPSTTITGNNPSPGTSLWTSTGSSSITSPSSASTVVSGLANGVNTFIYTITNGGCITRDTMLVTVSTLVTANAGPDRQVCTSTGSGTLSGNNPSPATGVWTAVTSGTITSPGSASTTVTGLTVAGFYSFVWTITNGGCVSRDTATFIVRNPVTANAGLDQQFCAATSTTITGNSPAPGSGAWTTTSGAVIATPSSFTSSVSGLSPGNNTFVYTTTYGACVSRDTMIVRIDTIITANAGPDQQICETTTTATMAANVATPGSGLWTKLDGGTITTPTSPVTTITALVPGTHRFIWTITNGSCVSRDTIIITVNVQIPSNAGLDQQVCQGSPANISGNAPAPGSGLWTALAGGTITSPSSASTSLTGLTTAGTYVFVWTVTNGACVVRDTVRVIVDSLRQSNAGSDQQLCNTFNATLSGNTAAPGTGTWTTTGTAVITSPSLPGSTVTNLAFGNNVFVWTIVNNSCTSRDTVIIRVDSIISAAAGTDQNICSSPGTAILAGNNPSPASGLWTVAPVAVFSNATSQSSSVSGLTAAGTYTFVWTITNGACIRRDTVLINVSALVTAAAGADQNLCSSVSTSTLAGNNAAPGTGSWTSTGSAVVTTPSSPTSNVTGLIIGNNTFIWTITNGSCVSRDTVVIHIDSLITADAGTDKNICAGSVATMTANAAAPGTGLWTALSSGTITAPSSATTTITGLNTAGSYDFVWTITNGTCTSRDSVRIAVDQFVQANAGADQSLCNVTVATLAGNNAAPGTGVWTTSGSAVITTPSNPLSGVTNLSVGDNVFFWTITNGTCVSRDTVRIHIDQLVTAVAGADQFKCTGEPITMAGNNPSPGTGTWTALNGGTVVTPSSATSSVTGITIAGTYNFVWTITNGTCTSRDTVTVHVSDLIIADAGQPQQLCNIDSTILSANNALPGTGLWTTTGSAIITDPTDENSSVTNLATGTNTFIWSITNGSCTSSDTVIVTVVASVIPDAGIDQQVCDGSVINLSGNDPTPGTGIWTAVSSGVIADSSQNITSVTGLTSGTWQFVWTINDNGCTGSDTVDIIIDQQVTADAGTDQQLCNVDWVQLTATMPAVGTGNWTALNGGTVVTPSAAVTLVTDLSAGLYQFEWTVTNNTCVTSDTVQVIIDSLIIADAGIDQQVCASPGTASLNAVDVTPYSGMWSSNAAVLFADPFSNATTVSGLTPGITELYYGVSNGICYSEDTVVITVDSNVVADAGPDQQICETSSSAILSGNVTTPGVGTWSTTSAAVITDPNDPNTSVTGLIAGTYDFIWTINNATCTTTDTVTVTVTTIPDAADAGIDQTACENTTVQLTANSPVIGTGMWSTTGTALFFDPFDSLTMVSGLLPGVTQLVWTITNGACTTSDTVDITTNQAPVVDAGADQFLTTGSVATLGGTPAATGGNGPYNYEWQPGTLVSDSVISNPDYTAGTTQQFILYVTDSLGCIGQDTVNVFVNDPADAVDDSLIITEDSTVVIDVLINDTDINGNINPGSVGILNGPFNGSATFDTVTGAVTYIPSANFAGSDSIFYTVCDSGVPVYCDSAWIYITVTPVNDAPIAVDDSAVTVQDSCIIVDVLLNDTDIENGLVPSSLIISSGAFHGTATVDTVTWQLTYCPDSSFTGTDTVYYSVCDSGMPVLCDSALVIISVNPQNHYPVAVNDSTRLCANDSSITNILVNDSDQDLNTLSATLIGTPVNGTASLLLNSLLYIPNAGYSGMDSIMYEVCDNGIPQLCDTAMVYFTVIQGPQVSSVITNVKCFGDSTGSVDVTVTGLSPFTYAWSDSSSTEDIDSVPAGVYTLIVSDSIGCAVTVNDTVLQPLAPLAGVMNLQPVQCFGDSSGAVDLQVQDGTPGYSYIWSTADTTEDIDSLFAGVYTVMITDSNGCQLSLTDTVLAPDSALIAVLTVNNIVCNGDSSGSVIATVSGGVPSYTYAWSNGNATDTISNLQSGIYVVTITDGFGCMLTAQDTVLDLNTPLLSNVTAVNPYCINEQQGSAVVTPSGGVGPYTFLWNTTDTTSSISQLTAGTYTVMITDSLGCIHTDSITLTDSSAIILSATDTMICEGDSVTLSVAQFTNAGYQWYQDGSIMPGDTTNQLITGTAAVYSIDVTAICGVFTDSSVTLTVNPLPAVDAGTDRTTTCDSSIALNGSGALGYSWTPATLCVDPLISTPTVSPQVTTDFILTTTDANGCSASDTVHVTVTCDSLTIPDGFSPNGDGINDFFVITKAGQYPGNTLQIFNRWGNLVYETTDYNNTWNGISNVSLKLGDTLTDGTYYYVFDTKKDKIYKGFVIIRR